jgi:hypothetical protein
MSEAPKTLHQKLLAVQKSVGNYLQAEKQGHQYKYVGSSDVLAPVRIAMDREGLLLLAEVLEHSTEPGSQRFTELTVRFVWINADNPQDREEFRWYGQGLDTGEKGVGKALTYAEKYFLLKTFHIATDKDDPDRFQRQHEDANGYDEEPEAAPATPPGLDEHGNPLNLVGLANAMAIDGTPKKFVKPAAALCEFDWDERENYTPEQLQAIRIEAHSMWQVEQDEQQEAVA